MINDKCLMIKVTDASSIWQEKIAQLLENSKKSTYLVFPDNLDDLAGIIKDANQQQWRVIACGNGSKLDWGSLIKNVQLFVSTQKCDRIVAHAVGDLTVTVEAGVKLADLQAKLQASRQFLPIDPVYPQEATIGGIVATADTGSWRGGYGGIRDLILGISFVRSDGKIAKGGGRVVKNVAGYDLMKLFTGSYGSLGVIAQVTLRTYPLPPNSLSIVITGETEAIAKALKIVKNSGLTPTAADLVTQSTITNLEVGNSMGLVLRFQTISESINEQLLQLKSIAESLGLEISTYQEDAEKELWEKLCWMTRIPHQPTGITCKLGILPTASVQLLQNLVTIAPSQYFGRVHLGSGLGEFHFLEENTDIIEKTRSLCQDHGGFLTILSAPKSVKQQLDTWGYRGNAASLMGKIKQQFDPQKMFREIGE